MDPEISPTMSEEEIPDAPDTSTEVVEGQEEQGDKEPEKETSKDPSTAELLKRIEAAEQRATAAEQDAAGKSRYVSALMDKLQEIAAKGKGTQQGDEAQSLFDQLQNDPAATIDQQVIKRLAPLAKEFAENITPFHRERGKQMVMEMDFGVDDNAAYAKKLWKKYEPEIDDFMKDMGTDIKTNGKAWLDAFNYVRAQHLNEEIADMRRAHIEENGRLEGGNSRSVRRNTDAPLSADERAIAKGFDMDDKDWRKFR